MRKVRVFFPVLLLVFFCICSFRSTEPKYSALVQGQASSNSNLNISILLDLSDRISPVKFPGFYRNDLGYITSIADAFEMHVKKKRIIMMNDQIQVFFEPSPSNPRINEIAQKLKVRVNRNNATKEYIQSIKPNYTKYASEIYNLSMKNTPFIGSDIWGFFNSKAKDYCIKPDSRNVLVILTDGYVYHKDKLLTKGNKTSFVTPALIKKNGLTTSNYANRFLSGNYGFIATRTDLAKLNVLVLGIKPSVNNPNDEDLLQLYWGKWFKEMGIKNYKIKNADLPANMDDIIKDFIAESR